MSYILDALRKADAQRERDPARGIHAQPAPLSIGVGARNDGYRLWIWGTAAVVLAVLASTLWYVYQDKAVVVATQPASVNVAAAPNSVVAETRNPIAQAPIAQPVQAMQPAPPVATTVLPPPPAQQFPPPPAAGPKRPEGDARNAPVPVPRGGPQGAQGTARTSTPFAAPPNGAPNVTPTAPGTAPATPPAAASATAPLTATPTAPMPTTPAQPPPPPRSGMTPAPATMPPPPAQFAAGLPPDAPKLAISGGVYSANRAQRMLIVNGQVFNEGADLGSGVVLEEIKPNSAVLRFRGARYTVSF